MIPFHVANHSNTRATTDSVQTPEYLYKYRSISGQAQGYAKSLVVNREVYFSPVSALNDVAEGTFRIPRLDLSELGVASEVANNVGAHITDIWVNDAKDQLRNAGVLSLSSSANCPLMWSYYADSSRGICVKINTDALAAYRPFSS